MKRNQKSVGFTLIELLIVVAIIAILAAIAIPNFLAAQTRSKVARARAEMRTLATALESYVVDFNVYPPYGSSDSLNTGDTFHIAPPGTGSPFYEFHITNVITTPVAYLTSQPNDPFFVNGVNYSDAQARYFSTKYQYVGWQWFQQQLFPTDSLESLLGYQKDGYYRMWSGGPDGDRTDVLNIGPPNAVYDPTNGTVSNGDIFRTWYSPEGIQRVP